VAFFFFVPAQSGRAADDFAFRFQRVECPWVLIDTFDNIYSRIIAPDEHTTVLHIEKVTRRGRNARAGHRETVALRQAEAMRYRVAGASFAQIGERLGVSAMQAHRDVMAGLTATLEQRNEQAECCAH
jgi:hypothetical protein